MLNCKQFVESATDAEEFEAAPFGKKLKLMFHQLLCHHCRKYNQQFRTSTAVAKNLTTEDASENIIDEAVVDMNNYSNKDNSSIN